LASGRLRGARILVTGGAGFVGSTIVDQLLDERVGEIVVLDNFVRGRRSNLEPAVEDARVRVVEGDVRDGRLVRELLEGIDVVFHQAALRITQCAAEPRAALEVMVQATFDLLEAAVDARVSRVVAASSASVYGQASSFPTDENHHPYDNRTLYGAAKLFNEGVLRSFHDMFGLDYVALRYFNVYGPRMDVHGVYTEVLVRWMARIEAGEPPLILGDGHQTMDFVYIDDVARANVLAALAPATDTVCNVATGTETSLLELATTLLEVMGSDLRPEHGPERSVNAVRRRQADVTKARDELGFTATVSLEEGLRRLVTWWRQEQALMLGGVAG
jgi:UDP-glucose 4-epimerase